MGSSLKDQKLRSKRKDVAMKQTLHFKAEFTISEGKIKDYKKLIKEMSNVVKANEPDTINYQFYFDRSEIRCILHETYKSSEAVFSHINGVASKTILPRIHYISRITRFEVFGAGSKKLQKAMERLDLYIYILFTGFSH